MTSIDRRSFMQGAAAAFLCALTPMRGFAQSAESAPGPFGLAAELKMLARSSRRVLVDAGTGNPNFLHLTARRAHSHLLQASLELTGPSGLRPSRRGLGSRLLSAVKELSADTSLAEVILNRAQEVSGLDSDEVADQLLQMLLGSTYAGFQSLARSAALSYQQQELDLQQGEKWHFFSTSGASEALNLLFQRFKADGVLGPGRRLAEIVPTFSPFSVWPSLRGDFQIDSVPLEPPGWTLTEQNLDTLRDRAVKVVYLVDPGNPVPTALDGDSVERFVRFIRNERDDLILLADSVYGCFPEAWRPIISELPENTIGIGSWSKHFGATGWRLGCLLVHPCNVLRDRLRDPLEKFVKPSPMTLPQQGMLTVFSLAQLTPWGLEYDEHLRELLSQRWRALYNGLGLRVPHSTRYSKFFAAVSLDEVARTNGLVPWPEDRELDFLRTLAAKHGAICLPFSGFSGPLGVLRISLASLSVEQSERIGRAIVQVLKEGHGAS